MKSRWILLLAGSIIGICVLWLIRPVIAETDTNLRRVLEDNHFCERLIKAAIYPKSSHDVYHPHKREFVRGLPRVTREFIFEPDKYTWNLAIAEHRRQIDSLYPPVKLPPGMVQPTPMEPTAIPPSSPEQVQLTPLGGGQVYQQIPTDADQKMQNLLERARASGIKRTDQLNALAIKQKLIDHMNSLQSGETQPAYPVLSLPRGRKGDSYDPQF